MWKNEILLSHCNLLKEKCYHMRKWNIFCLNATSKKKNVTMWKKWNIFVSFHLSFFFKKEKKSYHVKKIKYFCLITTYKPKTLERKKPSTFYKALRNGQRRRVEVCGGALLRAVVDASDCRCPARAAECPAGVALCPEEEAEERCQSHKFSKLKKFPKKIFLNYSSNSILFL